MRMRELRFKVVIVLDKLTIYLFSTRRKSAAEKGESGVEVRTIGGAIGL